MFYQVKRKGQISKKQSYNRVKTGLLQISSSSLHARYHLWSRKSARFCSNFSMMKISSLSSLNSIILFASMMTCIVMNSFISSLNFSWGWEMYLILGLSRVMQKLFGLKAFKNVIFSQAKIRILPSLIIF